MKTNNNLTFQCFSESLRFRALISVQYMVHGDTILRISSVSIQVSESGTVALPYRVRQNFKTPL